MDNYQPATGRYDQMKYKYCGKSGLQLPLISLGLWHNFGSVDDFAVAADGALQHLTTGSHILIWQTTTVLFRGVPKQTSGEF